jgi:hypothetical protein
LAKAGCPAPLSSGVEANNHKRSIIVDADEARIIKILETEEVPEVSEENLLKYRKYLIQHLDPKAIFTGREDFPWEEKYVFGPGSCAEYEKLKKTHPSYTDERSRCHYQKASQYKGQSLHNVTDFERYGIRQNALNSTAYRDRLHFVKERHKQPTEFVQLLTGH